MPVESLQNAPAPCTYEPCSRSRTATGSRELSEDEEKRVEELKARDAEVRRHEQAHKSAAGQYARGAPQFEYETGPDGRPYAVGGEVQVDTTPVPNDPQATIRKAEIVQRAALAPQDPSDQDRKVAAEAAKMKAEAQKELAAETGGNPLQVRTASYSPALYSPASDAPVSDLPVSDAPSGSSSTSSLLQVYTPLNSSPRSGRAEADHGRRFDREA